MQLNRLQGHHIHILDKQLCKMDGKLDFMEV